MKSVQRIEQLKAILGRLYDCVDELESLFPGRSFTLDGHIIGSVGEQLLAHEFGLSLLRQSCKAHDACIAVNGMTENARAINGRLVQLKVTQIKSVRISHKPQHLIVARVARDGLTEIVFNGPGEDAWAAAGKKASNGQYAMQLGKLRRQMALVKPVDQLPRRP
jgi:hypothetical protein